MPPLGFSTGALFKDRLHPGVQLSRDLNLRVIELSALRLRELPGLLEFIEQNDLSSFQYISIHAPTDFSRGEEESVAAALRSIAVARRWNVVVHPDTIFTPRFWKPLGELLCIENMDKRKPVGRTVAELEGVFAEFPLAKLCFDIAHARQVDTSMSESFRILRAFRQRICQLHMSELSSGSKHDRISDVAVESFREVLDFLPCAVPVILETPVGVNEARLELEQASRVFAPMPVAAAS